MPLGILNNIASISAENSLTLTSSALNSTLQQLSTGSRINTGADDAAGLAIANGLQANVTALTQSVSNANNGVGELQLADGALAQVTNLLNRAVTLATESATGTVSDSQRTALQAEYSSILSEINRVGSSTTYNGQAVFQGGAAPNVNAQDSPGSAGLAAAQTLTTGGATTVSSGSASFTYTASATAGATPHQATGATAALTSGTAIVTAAVLTLTRAGGTSVYTVGGAATTVGALEAVINSGVSTANIVVSGTDASHAGYTAALTASGNFQVTDATSTTGTLTAAETVGSELGAITANAGHQSTVQDLINAINTDTTVGAKATLTSAGKLEITDPQNRGNVAVSTTSALLGATAQGTATAFTTPNTVGTAGTDSNTLVGNATAALTLTTTLTTNATTALTAGGKSFSFTATSGQTVGDLINAINNPSDAAGLKAYIGATGTANAGQLVVTDANNNGNVAVGSTNTETVLGTLSNAAKSGSATTNIFLSDSTATGSSQIAVTIGALNTAAITNGTGGQAVNLAGTDLSKQTDAQTALTQINAAIANVASVRGTLGASVNRLTAASNVINSQVQNLTSAENTITAADIPSAVANLTKYSILEQTGISALAQANQQQQLVLKLLQ